jgi:hypothetical protein
VIDARTAGLPSFAPIASLSASNQTLNLIFVTFSGLYMNTSDDLWLPANQRPPLAQSFTAIDLHKPYTPDNPISVLSYMEQHQFCNPNRGPNDVRSTPMLPLGVLLDAWTDVTTGCFELVFDNYI